MKGPAFFLTASTVAMVVVACVSLNVGPTSLSMFSILDETQRMILWELRLPRILTACVVGGSLGVAGVGFQTLFRNPLAEPYIIGASSGAALGVTAALSLGIHFSIFGLTGSGLAALIGSLATVMIVFAIASIGNPLGGLSLLLTGVALSSMVNAAVSLLMFLNDDKIVVILSWLMGSLAANDWGTVATTSMMGMVGSSILWFASRPLDAYLLGNSVSRSLGMNLFRFRLLTVFAASLLTAAAVAAAGIIGFVGLIAPHWARFLVGPRHGWLIPMSGILGATLLLVADAVARTVVSPSELPVGIVTALLGCPFFLIVLLRQPRLNEDVT